jgi:hypothetical protein
MLPRRLFCVMLAVATLTLAASCAHADKSGRGDVEIATESDGILLKSHWGRNVVVVRDPGQSLGGFVSLPVELLNRNGEANRRGVVTVPLRVKPVCLIELRTNEGDPHLRQWRLGIAFAPADADAGHYRRTGRIHPAKAKMDDAPGGNGWLDVELVQWDDEPALPLGYGNLMDVKRIEFRRAERDWPTGRQWQGVVTVEGTE